MLSKSTVRELHTLRATLENQLKHVGILLSMNGAGGAMPRSKRHLSPEGIERIRAAQRKRWKLSRAPKPKKHWTQKPANRRKVARQLRAMNRARLKGVR